MAPKRKKATNSPRSSSEPEDAALKSKSNPKTNPKKPRRKKSQASAPTPVSVEQFQELHDQTIVHKDNPSTKKRYDSVWERFKKWVSATFSSESTKLPSTVVLEAPALLNGQQFRETDASKLGEAAREGAPPECAPEVVVMFLLKRWRIDEVKSDTIVGDYSALKKHWDNWCVTFFLALKTY